MVTRRDYTADAVAAAGRYWSNWYIDVADDQMFTLFFTFHSIGAARFIYINIIGFFHRDDF